jgi:hypothetical protein
MQANSDNTTEIHTAVVYGAIYIIAGTSDLMMADDLIVLAGQIRNISNFDFFCD